MSPPARLVVPLDLPNRSQHAVDRLASPRWGLELARGRDAELAVVCRLGLPVTAGLPEAPSIAVLQHEAHAAAREPLALLPAGLRAGRGHQRLRPDRRGDGFGGDTPVRR